MKRKFFLHRQNEPMKSDTVVYRVWIGESVKEQRMLTQLMSWAFRTGATLRTWSEDIDLWLQHESDRVFHDCGILNFGFVSADITASEMSSLVESGNWDIFEKNLSTPKAYIYQLTTLAPSRLREGACDTGKSIVLTSKSKNLNQRAHQDKVVIRFS